jgi:hypothetical protein
MLQRQSKGREMAAYSCTRQPLLCFDLTDGRMHALG